MGRAGQRTAKVLMRRWRITEMDVWEQDDIDLVAPGFVEFGEDYRGSLGLIAVRGEIDRREVSRDGQPGVISRRDQVAVRRPLPGASGCSESRLRSSMTRPAGMGWSVSACGE